MLHPILRAIYGLFTGGPTSTSSCAPRVTVSRHARAVCVRAFLNAHQPFFLRPPSSPPRERCLVAARGMCGAGRRPHSTRAFRRAARRSSAVHRCETRRAGSEFFFFGGVFRRFWRTKKEHNIITTRNLYPTENLASVQRKQLYDKHVGPIDRFDQPRVREKPFTYFFPRLIYLHVFGFRVFFFHVRSWGKKNGLCAVTSEPVYDAADVCVLVFFFFCSFFRA